jgi:hypothetical protein
MFIAIGSFGAPTPLGAQCLQSLTPGYFAPKGACPLFVFGIYKHLTPDGVKLRH